jgi:AAHS family 4-hydroxybenzoate transporter-like MFS transporter
MSDFRIQPFMDIQRLRAVHYTVLGICAAIMFIDGLDIFMVGKIAPAIAKGFGVRAADMTTVFVAQQIGLAIGAFTATPLADRFGRRTMLIGCATIFGVLTLAAAFAQDLVQFAALRGVAAIFLAGVMPMAVALLSEITPHARRSQFISFAMIGYSAGSAAGGAIAAWLIDLYTWRSGVWVGGLLPLACVPLMLLLLPESIQFMVGRKAARAKIEATLQRVDPGLTFVGDEVFVVADGSRVGAKANPFDIFRDGRARTTVLYWLVCILSMSNIAILTAWLPTFFQEMAGVPIQRFAVFAMIGFAGGVVGTLSIGWLMDRIRPSRLIACFYLGLAICVALLIVWYFFQTGGQSGLNMLAPQIYPASMRSTGLGWAGGAGRVAGIGAPILGGWALTSHLTLQATLMIIAVMPLAVSLLILLLRPQMRAAAEAQPAPA